jgi:hypothetical protein
MSIIPASRLTTTDLALLSNNLRPVLRKDRSELDAVNRSLAIHQESVRHLFKPPAPTGAACTSRLLTAQH